MNVKEMVELNNQRRKLLTKENLKYYEDMLVYIRLSYDKSDQEIEEVLLELLDHLLEAQKEGRTAKEVFGRNPKEFADEIVGALPKLVTKEKIKYSFMIIFFLFGVGAIISPILTIVSNYFSDKNPFVEEIYIGSAALKALLSIPLAFLLLFLMLQFMRWTCFKNFSKMGEFFITWIFMTMIIGVFVVFHLIIPDFGQKMEVHVLYSFFLGVVLLILGYLTLKRITSSKVTE